MGKGVEEGKERRGTERREGEEWGSGGKALSSQLAIKVVMGMPKRNCRLLGIIRQQIFTTSLQIH